MGTILKAAQRVLDAAWSVAHRPRASGNTITTSAELEQVLLRRGFESRSGIPVTAETAMMVAAVGSAVSLLAESVAQLPLVIYRRRADNGKDRAPEHPLWRLLHDRPNGFQNAFEFREMLTLHLLLWGNGYAFKNRLRTGSRAGQVSELLPLHPDRVQPEQDERYVVTYRVALPSGDHLILPADRVFHIRDRSFDGVVGASRLRQGQDSIGLSLAAERWGAQLFGNGARPSGVLSSDQKLTKDQITQIAESWKAAHGGENALGTAVLDGGMKWEPLVMNNRDAQFLETRKFQISEVARIYRLPPHMIGDLERATHSNIEHQGLEFVKYSLMPWLRRWEMAINTQLLDPGQDVFAEFLVEGFLRGDLKSRYDAYAIGVQNGWLSPNEIRGLENMNPREGGDEYKPAANLFGSPSGGGDEPAQPA